LVAEGVCHELWEMNRIVMYLSTIVVLICSADRGVVSSGWQCVPTMDDGFILKHLFEWLAMAQHAALMALLRKNRINHNLTVYYSVIKN